MFHTTVRRAMGAIIAHTKRILNQSPFMNKIHKKSDSFANLADLLNSY